MGSGNKLPSAHDIFFGFPDDYWREEMEIYGYRLVLTCQACPEQYDVFLGNERVGYLRLRRGHFTAQVMNPIGEYVYAADTLGDGIFDPLERPKHLRAAVTAIQRASAGISPLYKEQEAERLRDAAWVLKNDIEKRIHSLSLSHPAVNQINCDTQNYYMDLLDKLEEYAATIRVVGE